MDARDRLIVALDVPSLAAAEALADRLEGVAKWFKVGSQLFTAAGPAAVTAMASRGQVFLDTKYHDIPSTVAGAVAAATEHGIALCTVHAAGGTSMMRAAREAADRAATAMGRRSPRVIGVTLLTSGDPAGLAEAGLEGSPLDATLRLARLARAADLAGVVTSPLEVEAVRAACGPGFLLVCPGIRPGGSAGDDQRRVRTPRDAIAAGADMLVVGRPITRAPDPRAAAEEIVRQIGAA